MSDTRVLLRIHRFDAQAAALAERLRAETRYDVVVVADESRGTVACGGWPKLAFTAQTCRALGLHWQPDAGWRCGDYGFYLAQAALPPARFVWMIEPDVLPRFGRLDLFFAAFAGDAADALLCQFRPADTTWYWYHAMRMRRAHVYRCLFPVVRLSAGAIAALLAARQLAGRSAALKFEWPNDEAFVATEAMALGLSCKDLNDCGRVVYDDASMSYHWPIDGDALRDRPMDSKIYHPVLYGEALAAKQNALRRQQKRDSLRARVTRRVMRLVWT
jgi:hypothetical protein